MKNQRTLTVINLLLIIIPTLVGLGIYCIFTKNVKPPIKIGLLHSITGNMAVFEKSVIDTMLVAIDEINTQGGLFGRLIEPIIADGMSDVKIFAQEAEKLIKQHKVQVIFGCWTSSSRKIIKPIVEKYNALLFYPTPWEGLEESPNIIYIGATANQQIIPAVSWCLKKLGKRFFLIGTDRIYPHAVHEIIKTFAPLIGGEIVGEAYIFPGSRDIAHALEQIQKTKPDVILNSINGSSNINFFQELRRAGISSEKIPTMSFNIGESDFSAIGINNIIGDYACSSYFQSVEGQENENLIRKIQKKYGAQTALSESDQNGYAAIHLWALAAQKSGSLDPKIIKQTLKDISIHAPEGALFIDQNSSQAWKMARIGKIAAGGQFVIIWDSKKPLEPILYPSLKKKREWELFLTNLYNQWHHNWENPQEQKILAQGIS